jgi:hypothetical protein
VGSDGPRAWPYIGVPDQLRGLEHFAGIDWMNRTQSSYILVHPDNVQALPSSRTPSPNVNTVLLREVVHWAQSVATEADTIAQDLLQHAQAMAQTLKLKQIRTNSHQDLMAWTSVRANYDSIQELQQALQSMSLGKTGRSLAVEHLCWGAGYKLGGFPPVL